MICHFLQTTLSIFLDLFLCLSRTPTTDTRSCSCLGYVYLDRSLYAQCLWRDGCRCEENPSNRLFLDFSGLICGFVYVFDDSGHQPKHLEHLAVWFLQYPSFIVHFCGSGLIDHCFGLDRQSHLLSLESTEEDFHHLWH